MIPAKFDYERADSVEEAVQLLQESKGEGMILAGGHSLLPIMKFRLTEPGKLVDISGIPGLTGAEIKEDRLIIGAMTTHFEVANDPLILETAPVLAEAASLIGDIQIRNRGTIGGNIAHGDPVADLPAPALALDAELIIHGEDGEERMSVDGFTLGPLITLLPENSIIKEISFEIPPTHTTSTYLKFFHHATGYPVVGVAAIVGVDEVGAIDYLRIGITGVGEVVYRAKAVEQVLMGTNPTATSIEEASKLAAEDGDMGSDMFASEAYRGSIVKVYVERALKSLLIR